jgi:hypothetical protein
LLTVAAAIATAAKMQSMSSKSAIISTCGTYRYLLTRTFGPSPKTATFIMLNPSTADAAVDDQTIRKCIGFAKKWGCGGFRVINLFAVRARDPVEMKRHPAPQGPDNKKHFDEAIRAAKDCPHQGPIVCAWGNHGLHMRQDVVVLDWLQSHQVETMAITITGKGQPGHPLTLSYDLPLIPFSGHKRQG